jgi:malonyl-CoA/methylmalonyl-CoA synthetase
MLGAVVVPANTGYTAREIAHIVSDAQPVAVIVDDPVRAGMWQECGVATALRPSHRAGIGAAAGDGGDESAAPPQPSDPALIGYTSGTTGVPKGAVLSHANLLAGSRSVIEAWAWSSNDVLVLALPLFHMHGLGVGVTGTLVSGASAVVLPAFDVDRVLDAIAVHDASMFFGVPTMYARLARSPRCAELATLRLAVSGSAPLPEALWTRLRDASGLEVLERYGMTETMMLTSNPLHGERRAGSVGRALPGVQVRLGAGDVVEVRGPNVFAGYLGRAEATAVAFTDDGWFVTGDVGRLDSDGYLTLVGRSSELIITGGYNVYPREVEDVLRAVPGVVEVAVIGLPDEEWGEVVTACVVVTADAGDWEDQAQQVAAAGLASYKVPRRWTQVEALPRNAMGKVLRGVLAESVASGAVDKR